MFFESAGRPFLYGKDGQQYGDMSVTGDPYFTAEPGKQSASGSTNVTFSEYQWADPSVYAIWGNSPSNTGCTLTSVMNCENYSEIYAFHPGGANFLFGDGSVTFVTENLDVDTFVSMFTSSAAISSPTISPRFLAHAIERPRRR